MIIRLVALLVLLSEETKEENEIQWFFPKDEAYPRSDSAQFLGWKMGGLGHTESTQKGRGKSSSTAMTKPGNVHLRGSGSSSRRCFYHGHWDFTNPPAPLDPSKSEQIWKTLLVADSTIHYIPLEEIATAKSAFYPIVPAEDALDPFYLDPLELGAIDRDQQTFQKFDKKIHLEPNLKQIAAQMSKPLPAPLLPSLPLENVARYPVILHPPSYNRILPSAVESNINKIPIPYGGKFKGGGGGGPRFWSEPRHTMFIHPKLLDMMRSMDQSILSYPSRFKYKSMDQLPMPIKSFVQNKAF